MKTEQTAHPVTLSRIRLAQRILVMIGEYDPSLYMHTELQKALVHTTKLRLEAELKYPTIAERKTLDNKLRRFDRVGEQIGGPSPEECLQELEKVAVNQ